MVTAVQNVMGNKEEISRRRFLITGWFGFLGFLVSCIIITVIDFFKPKVLHETPMIFKAGLPEEYLLNAVSTKWIEDQKVWLIRNEKGLYALSAICTHLGCTPRWVNEDGLFKCPCHGSNFNINGDVIAGPAPSALRRFSIGLSENGQVVINKSIKENRVSYREGGKFLLKV
jgi:cytochrome b6-f complex iron-sulfur subunit